ncbi:hypothetical protein D3C87_234120 [compost metagenome]
MANPFFKLLIVLIPFSFMQSCTENTKRTVCTEQSIWRDNDGADSCSYYSTNESCEKVLGKLMIRSRLHKDLLENKIFEGGLSSRWLEIGKDSIHYFTPDGELVDKGSCHCANGIMKIDWKIGENLPEECEIYFNSADFVELRYYDHPFNFNVFEYETEKKADNPTKIIGTIE